MKLKEFPEDFIVEEKFDLNDFKDREENRKQDFYYFKLEKKNMSQMEAIQQVARGFNTSRKLVHFAGTKDKNALTTQLISVYGINTKTYEKNLEFLNGHPKLNLEFLGKFKGRVSLGDSRGNKFKINIRDLSKEEVETIKKNIPSVRENGILNYFDEQRFGYAGNTHIVGRELLKGNLRNAVYEILTTLPPLPKEEHSRFVEIIKNNWEDILKSKNHEIIDKAIEIAPSHLNNEEKILKYFKKHCNDAAGAFRTLHKKQRTLYINAFQSYLFNSVLSKLYEEGKVENYPYLPLITHKTEIEKDLERYFLDILNKEGITLEDFNLPSLPDITPHETRYRETKIYPEYLECINEANDDVYEGKKQLHIHHH